MANEQNLIPFSQRSKNEAREEGRKGGVASGAARRRKRSMREAADLFLSLPVSNPQISQSLENAGLDVDDIDYQMAVVAGMTIEAVKGNPKAAKVLMEMLGGNKEDEAQKNALNKLDEVLDQIGGVV